MSGNCIGIDLGGSRIKGVVIDTTGNILHQCYRSTCDGTDGAWKDAVAEVVQELGVSAGATIGISAPGLPNESNSAIAYMPGRLQGLENFLWSGFLGIGTFVLNDAIAALMAEARYGAAKNRKNAIMLTLGTGVGGAILIDGKPYQGAFCKAGHLGHMVIDSNGEQDITGIPGSLEDAIGNCSLAKRSFGKYNTTQQLLEAFRNGDLLATEVWLTSVRKLAVALASLTNILSPEIIVLGGGITEAGADLFNPLEEYMNIFEWRAGGYRAEIVKASLGDLSGAVGAACFAREKG
ncbi:MAG: ROK family protein [Mariniphaga sp.]|nr:ROK family protein [Mariniphaga sp.]MDD4225433.1 ROK family protein [Mariniphaga sp.]